MATESKQLREEAQGHARQLEAITWPGVPELHRRWRISPALVRAIPRDKLPYLTFGKSDVRRYDPRDVEAYEQTEKRGAA